MNVRMLKNIIRRKTARALIVSFLFSLISYPLYGDRAVVSYGAESSAEPDVALCDETLYVNLDYYGGVSKVNVVKGVSSTADMEYMDYGSYTDVTNMSNDEEIKLTDDGVSFPLKGDGSRFYYEGKLSEDETELPWSFDISYKLNGLPVKAEELAGANGLIETDIHVSPNENCSEYMRNNMLLSCLIPIDDEKVYSVDAPGSQTQTVGDITGVMFSALPGEEKDFVVRLGCNDFESIGVIFLIVPARMDSFDNIKDIKELKDTWRDSGDAMYESFDDMLSVIESMRTETSRLRESLEYMESARAKISGNKDAILDSGDATAAALKNLADATGELVPYVGTGKEALEKLDENLDAVVITLTSMQKPLNNMFWGLNRIQDGSDDLRYGMDKLKPYIEDFKEEDERLQDELADLISAVEEAMGEGGALEALSEADTSALIDEYDLSDMVSEFCEDNDIDESLFYDYIEGDYEDDDLSSKDIKRFKKLEKALYEEVSERGIGLENIAELMKNLNETKTVLGSIAAQRDTLTEIASASSAVADSADDLLYGVGRTAGGAKMVSRELINLTNDVRNFDAIVGMYYDDMQGSLSAVERLLGSTQGSLGSAASMLSLIQSTLRDASGDVDESLKTGISSAIALTDKSMGLFDSVSGIRESGELMKGTLDNELDKFEEENTFLNIDPEAKPVSFTSDKNRNPESIQIIIRSDEISAEDDDHELKDAERPEEKTGIFARIANVFIRIWEVVRSVFE